MSWEKSQFIESSWWGKCEFAYQEEIKQSTYARLMGLRTSKFDGKMAYDGLGKSIIDIGGGPASILLKTINTKDRYVLDPITYPKWVELRYMELGINRIYRPAEDFELPDVDEVWLYNVLQHVQDPSLILKKIINIPVIRIFEWINCPTNDAHPHSLSKEFLDDQLNTNGNTTFLNGENDSGCFGIAYHKVITKS
jgi:hypothetical protein